MEHVVFEFRKLSRSCHSISVYHERRQYFCESVFFSVKVEHEVDNRSFQSRTESLVDRESRTCDLCSSFKVQDIKICTDVPVCFFFKIELLRLSPFSQLDICAVVCSHLNVFVRCVRDVEQCVAQIRLNLPHFCIEDFYLIRKLLHLCHEFSSVFSFFFHNRDLLGRNALLVLHLLYLGKQLSSFLVKRYNIIYSEVSLSSRLNGFLYVIKILSYSLDIQHFLLLL